MMRVAAACLLLSSLAIAQNPTKRCLGSVSDNTNAPKSYHCGFEGSFANANPKESFSASFNECRDHCLEEPRKCNAFSFKPTDGMPPKQSLEGNCKTYLQHLGEQNPKAGKTGVFFYLRKCYVYQSFPITPTPNGDFQDGTLSPWFTDRDGVQLVSEDDNGVTNYSAELTASCDDGDECQNGNYNTTDLAYPFNLTSGVEYNLRFDIVQPVGLTTDNDSYYAFPLSGSIFLLDYQSGNSLTLVDFQNVDNQIEYTGQLNTHLKTNVTEGNYYRPGFNFPANHTGSYAFVLNLFATKPNTQFVIRVDDLTVTPKECMEFTD